MPSQDHRNRATEPLDRVVSELQAPEELRGSLPEAARGFHHERNKTSIDVDNFRHPRTETEHLLGFASRGRGQFRGRRGLGLPGLLVATALQAQKPVPPHAQPGQTQSHPPNPASAITLPLRGADASCGCQLSD